MEILDVAVNDFSRRSGSLLVSHVSTTLTRGLEPGERIVIVDGPDCWDGEVVDLQFSLEDTMYRIELGACLSRLEVLELLTRLRALDGQPEQRPRLRGLG